MNKKKRRKQDYEKREKKREEERKKRENIEKAVNSGDIEELAKAYNIRLK